MPNVMGRVVSVEHPMRRLASTVASYETFVESVRGT